MMRERKRVDTLMPLETGWTALEHGLDHFMILFTVRVGPFKTLAMIFCVYLSISLIKLLSGLQDFWADGNITLGEYESCVIGWSAMTLIVLLYEFYYVDHVIREFWRWQNL